MNGIPDGFVLDQAPQQPALPEGFVLDAPTNGMLAKDVALSVPSSLARGVTGLVGLPGAVQQGVRWLGDVIESTVRGETTEETSARHAPIRQQAPNLLPTPQAVQSTAEQVTGPFYKSQTVPGKFVGQVAEFIPGALAGPGGVARKLVNFAVAPGVASELAGQATADTAYEPWARAGAALLAGGTAAVVNRAGTPQQVLRRELANVDTATINRAQALMQDAQRRGVTLTWAEALEQVAPGTGLTNLQRTLEATPGSREVLNPIMAQRPAQVERAARDTFDTIAPVNPAPSSIGPAVANQATSTINDVRGAINAHTAPMYTAAESVRLTPAEMRAVVSHPSWPAARAAVRNDPQLNSYVQHLPDDSVGFLNEVKKYVDQQARNAQSPIAQQQNMQRAASFERDATAYRNIGTRASSDYAYALHHQAALREQYLEPLLQGPLGRLAKNDMTTKRAIDAVFPTQPLPNSAQEIATAMTALAHRSPSAARDLVRAHAESVFNEAIQNLQSGANQFGGAKFAAVIVGNPQQRANLEAAVRALPNGNQVWNGFNRFLEIAEATGKRQQVGSKTAYNTQELKDLSTGGIIANTTKTVTSPNKMLSAISDAWSRWQLGRNVDQLARIITDPNSAGMLRALAGRPAGSHEALVIAGRLVNMIGTARQERNK